MMSQVDDNEMDTRFEVGSTVFAYVDIRPRMAENGRRLPEDFQRRTTMRCRERQQCKLLGIKLTK